jgi:hypothetical protein
MRNTWLVIVCGLVACKDKPNASPTPPPSSPPGDAAFSVMTHEIPVDAAPPPPGDWAACKAALEKVPSTPPTKRVELIIDACHPCGDWKPLLDWQTLQEDGGPNRKVIDSTMAGCKAYCSPNAKIQFMGALDDGRAKKTRTPWRVLAQQCGEEISARPDGRYMTAPYLALDRIARWAGEQPDGAKLLEPIVIPLPAVSQSGVGVPLPDSAVTKPDIIAVQITVTTAGINVGAMPTAKLAANGVVPQGDTYPGKTVTAKALAGEVKKLGATKVAVFAHPNLAATALLDPIASAGVPVVLAVSSSMGPVGWKQHGVSPIELHSREKPASGAITFVLDDTGDAATAEVKKLGADAAKKAIVIQLDENATVASLATLLGALAYFEVPSVNLVAPSASSKKTTK